ncbi:MAG: hypothetical protein M1832_006445 [Thelocarpon impressellum]|nr:MAG: hypothetical protein M1832_006445 [Thelocarpon impressellum]
MATAQSRKVAKEAMIDNMSTALGFLNRGVEQLRLFNVEAANSVSRQLNEVLEQVMTAVLEAELQEAPPLPPAPDYDAYHRASEECAAITVPVEPHLLDLPSLDASSVVAASPDEAASPEPLSAAETLSQERVLDLTVVPNAGRPNPALSWARVAALEDQDRNVALSITTEAMAAATATFQREHAPKYAPGRVPSGPGLTAPAVRETEEESQRVVWIMHCPTNLKLSAISAGINEGPIMSIVFARDRETQMRAACVIFQRAEHARALLANHELRCQNSLHSFFPGETVLAGSAYARNADVAQMDAPTQARRRLTLVRKGLFMDVTRSRFETDIYALAGRDNVEQTHIYNSGNATVILASVKCAALVKRGLEAKARGKGPYRGCVVTFSKDPCEADVRLVSAFHGAPPRGFRP